MIKKAISLTAAALMLTGSIAASAEEVRKNGDVNGDGSVTVTDISLMAAHIKSKKDLDEASRTYADVNFDGIINVTDISAVAAYVKGVRELPFDPDGADEFFKGYDAYLIYADKDMNWGNWNGQGYHGVPSYGIDADVIADGEYSVSITRESITSADDTGLDPGLLYEEYWDGERYLKSPNGCSIMCVDITGILDGTLAADGSELEGFLKDGDDANINKKVKGRYKGDEIKVELISIQADGWDIDFDASKVRYGNLDEEDNCYRIEIANLFTGSAEDAAIDVEELEFWNSLTVNFRITGLDEPADYKTD